MHGVNVTRTGLKQKITEFVNKLVENIYRSILSININ